MTPLGPETGITLVAALALVAVALFVVASLVGRWPLWLAGFLAAIVALAAAFALAPGSGAADAHGGGGPDIGSIAPVPEIHYNQEAAPAGVVANPQPQG